MKKIAIVTATRAEYGLLKPLIQLVATDPELELQLLVTGAHLSHNHGNTWQHIQKDGFHISKKIEILLATDGPTAVSKAMGLAQLAFAEAFEELQPDLIVILGDRYEMLAIASTALIFNLPIAHLHGGELTYGAIDDSIRHAITKMSHLHFVATESYRQRVIQMGEAPNTVFNVGAIGLDSIKHLNLLNRQELEKQLGTSLQKQNIIVTQHPETKSKSPVQEQISNLLQALDDLEDTLLVFTGANADAQGTAINTALKNYADQNPHKAIFRNSLGQLNYLSCLKHFDMVVGNSSSGIIETPSFKIPVVNIGDRQLGRLMSPNIIHCSSQKTAISQAIQQASHPGFKAKIQQITSPYGDGQAAPQILQIIKHHKTAAIKTFFDISSLNLGNVSNA